jgi:hypothetical protein
MKYIHFLGSVHFAITLIGVFALFILMGTVIESRTGSHLFAAYYTYQHPAFLMLLGLFFTNILFASLRRWPFKLYHIPFLITHLGLLMILLGVILKSSFGVQGTMAILEGSGTHEILIPNTFSIKIQKKNREDSQASVVSEYPIHSRVSPFPELQIETIEYAPHSSEITETWIKGDHGIIAGIKPFKVFYPKNLSVTPLPISARVLIFPPPAEPWNLFAFRSSNVSDSLEIAYLEGLVIRITDSITNEWFYQGALREALTSPPQWKHGKAILQLKLEENVPVLLVTINDDSKKIQANLTIPLTGPEALDNIPKNVHYLGGLPIAIDLERPPALFFIQNQTSNDTHIFAFDPYGRIHQESFPAKGLSSLVAYDSGASGYYAQSLIPFFVSQGGRQQKENAYLKNFENILEIASQTPEKLAPPLKMLYNACQKAKCDFAKCCSEYLSFWNKSYSWLYPLDHPVPPLFVQASKELNWSEEPFCTKKCCDWLSHFFLEIDPLLRQEASLNKILEKWPTTLPDGDENFLLTTITQQVFSVGELLPDNQTFKRKVGEEINARLFSAYLRAYTIHLNNIDISNDTFSQREGFHLECPLTLKYIPKPSLKKWEDCIPIVKLKLKKGDQTEYLTLSYDRTASGLYWPAFKGEYLLRFQPSFKNIPYHIRLRNARRIDYPNSTQPYSYESDLLITHSTSNLRDEKTISMNNVHETWDGFRFYLAGLSTSEETAAKQIQLVVNHDPAKYWLTYPGGSILALGIGLLFWKRKIRNI